MKTKFLRFNKLPRIQTNIDPDSDHSKPQNNAFGNLANSVNRRSDGIQYKQLLDVFDGLMKKSIREVHHFELQARDRSVLVDLPESESLDDELLKEWITDVCNAVFSSAFHSLSKDNMSYEHTKSFCSEGILKNIVLLTQKYRLNNQQMQVINHHIQERIVPYMQRKYPLTESNDVNKTIDERVKPIDNREALQNDLLKKWDGVFRYNEDGIYNKEIMLFVNWLMTSVDQKGDTKGTIYEEFYNDISRIFENVKNQDWMNNSRPLEKEFKDVTPLEREKLKNEKRLSLEVVDPTKDKYAQQVKQYTHYAIGRKISKNVPTFTEQEIYSGHLAIKNPAVLRILTKWCQQLWEKFKTKNYFLDREENVRVQQKGGNVNTMFMWMKMPLNDLIEEEKIKIQNFMSEVQENNYDQQSRLLLRELEKDGFTHVERYEKACGKFGFKIVANLHSYIVLYLNRIIHGLLKVSKQLYDTKLSTKARWTSPPDLLSFKIGDLMRCKIASKQRQILKIFQYLDDLSESSRTLGEIDQAKLNDQDKKTLMELKSHSLKIIRIKNRLKLGTNDILVNVIYKDKYLCEIQLGVNSAKSKFIQCSNLFSHYVYELGRTLFGPVTQLCSIWMSLDPRGLEYLNLNKNEERQIINQPLGCAKNGLEHDYEILDRPFICSDCNKAYSHTNYIWEHQRCLRQQCGHMICALCRIERQDPHKLKQKLLKSEPKDIQSACTNIVSRKPTIQERGTIPEYGVCIQIQSKRIKVKWFKKLQIKRIMTIYGFKKVIVNGVTVEKAVKLEDLVKKQAEKRFLRKHLVFEIPKEQGERLINITVDRAKKQYIIPEKVKEIYKKEKEILSLIDQNIDDQSINIMKGTSDGMARIANMELADNKLTNIKFIVQNFPNIDRLQLSRNKLTSIQGISSLKFMKKLNIRDNSLTSLPNEIEKLQLLEGINIRNNQLTELPECFGNLKQLKKLESDKNKFKDLPQSFKNLTKLTFLDLSANKLTSFPKAIQNFKKLKELALAKNSLDEIPEWIGQLKELITLDLSKCAVKNLPQTIYLLKNLQIFKIETFHDSISPEIGNLLKLKHLSIQMKNLKSLPDTLLHLTNSLSILELEECKIKALPDWMSEMKILETFTLINNDIDTLDKELTQMTKLKYLRIEGQKITELPVGMRELKELRTISLNNNCFKKIPDILTYYEKLYDLSIKDNQIEQIPEDYFNDLPNLEALNLDNNKLNRLPLSIENLRRLKKLSYLNNPAKNDPKWIERVKANIDHTLKMDDFNIKRTVSISSSGVYDSKIK